MTLLDYVPLAMLFFLACFGVLIYVASRDILSIFVCSLPLVLIFLLVARSTFRERRDELKIFENGFTYIDRKLTVNCLWNEVDDYSQTTGAFGGAEKLTSIRKSDGTWIPIATNMQGEDQLWPHMRIVPKWDGPEK